MYVHVHVRTDVRKYTRKYIHEFLIGKTYKNKTCVMIADGVKNVVLYYIQYTWHCIS